MTEEIKTYFCKSCKQRLPAGAFYWKKRGNGIKRSRYTCKACCCARARKPAKEHAAPVVVVPLSAPRQIFPEWGRERVFVLGEDQF